jgi:Zn-dependent protease with chaperone function
MEAAKSVEKKDRSWMLILCGLVVLVIAALIGHGSLPDDKTRETAFIILLIAGAVFSAVGLYLSTSRRKETE